MTATLESLYMEVLPEKLKELSIHDAAERALHEEADHIRAAVGVLSSLSQDPAEGESLSAAAAAMTAEDRPRGTAIEILPYIQRAVEPYTPRQIDPSRPVAERWTKDWDGVKKALKDRLSKRPELENELTKWFLSTGSSMVKTTYPEREYRRPFIAVGGAAKEQCVFRNTFALAMLASPKFRDRYGMETQRGAMLNGEDGLPKGWLKDPKFIETLRSHVAERIEAGEVTPRIVVSGSGDAKRVLVKEDELKVVKPYIDAQGNALLYPERGLTEADAMLAGAQYVYGVKEGTNVSVQEYPAADANQLPTKLVSFESLIGPITFIATTGSEASFLKQLRKTQSIAPEMFEGIDAFLASTTGIYTWEHQRTISEAAGTLGVNPDYVDVQACGFSTHAAGAKRQLSDLVGELPIYLKAMYNTATRSIEAAERNAAFDRAMVPQTLGEIAVQTVIKNPLKQFFEIWKNVLRRIFGN